MCKGYTRPSCHPQEHQKNSVDPATMYFQLTAVLLVLKCASDVTIDWQSLASFEQVLGFVRVCIVWMFVNVFVAEWR